jgi:hypothetical protein
LPANGRWGTVCTPRGRARGCAGRKATRCPSRVHLFEGITLRVVCASQPHARPWIVTHNTTQRRAQRRRGVWGADAAKPTRDTERRRWHCPCQDACLGAQHGIGRIGRAHTRPCCRVGWRERLGVVASSLAPPLNPLPCALTNPLSPSQTQTIFLSCSPTKHTPLTTRRSSPMSMALTPQAVTTATRTCSWSASTCTSMRRLAADTSRVPSSSTSSQAQWYALASRVESVALATTYALALHLHLPPFQNTLNITTKQNMRVATRTRVHAHITSHLFMAHSPLHSV